ncbi:hypothetical protein [Butyrivibrio sp. INlla16]|uniref:hypothetical protein n=1 Tax=Butyrivibrio sp. INlla16 TaxID=1520807 RepID=UPI00088F2F8A|nr:hypothetical protein [Butyrivibrio sp. INlla16]SDB69375.1 hypothetical protein SAMN02910263_04434 [Butyrivibrio sp. INlla16]
MRALKRTYLVFTSTALWTIAAIPVIYVLRECMNSYVNGTIHGFNSDVVIYGIEAFADTLLFFLAFFVVIDVLWAIVVVLAIVTTVTTIRHWSTL